MPNQTISKNNAFQVLTELDKPTKDYFFRHHLETNVEDNSALKGITWRREGLSGLKDIVKVRLNHLGKIVHTGEY